MAKSNAVWGIDIGQCALKALRCRPHEKDEQRIVVEAFDYIEYPKILSQPEADPEELVREALEQFVSRNDLTGDGVAISVPGQSGLARFIKLPPVEKKKIPDIVKYEARQQIPFALEDVVWDYQPLAGGDEDEGYALETEIGLFAMKRDQVSRALRPLEEAGIEVEIIQLAPLAIYNFVCFDRLAAAESGAPYDPDNPPPSTVVIAFGTDTTDLVITDGYRVWQRNIPKGGTHFTKALSKELKLTFAKAEHLKRNATKAENPKAVFQAMRPVFSDLVAEIQRSIGFFTSNNRNAKLGDVIALGNPMKLPGLQRFLSQNLDQEVKPLEEFRALVGGSATAAPQFKENQLTFGVSYGLCVQALGRSRIKTNLLPHEIVTERLIREKKPWAVAAAALLLVGMAINYASNYSSFKSAATDELANPSMARAIADSKRWLSQAQRWSSEHSDLTQKFDTITQIGHNLQSNVDGRLLWLELLKAVDAALPKDTRPADQRQETAADVTQRNELLITAMNSQHFDDLSVWYKSVAPLYLEAKQSMSRLEAERNEAAPAQPDASAQPSVAESGEQDPYQVTEDSEALDAEQADPDQLGEGEAQATPTGPGWVIELVGHHFHNNDPTKPGERAVALQGKQFIEATFFKDLEQGTVTLPDGPNGELIEVPIAELGISYPVVMTKARIEPVKYLPEATSEEDARRGARAAVPYEGSPERRSPGRTGRDAEDVKPREVWQLNQYDFVIQFCWQPKPRGQRLQQWAAQGKSFSETASLHDTTALPDGRNL